MIELISISKNFGPQKVLENISFNIMPGEKLCIIGQSGSGKSVLMKLIVGLMEPDKGEIKIEGKNIHQLGRKGKSELLQNFGLVFQGSALFDSLTVLENVGIRLFEERLIPNTEIINRVSNALSSVGLVPIEILEKFPAELSGGMQKRVGIARAIVHLPQYVFYDEPTTGLDPLSAEKVDLLIEELSEEKGRTSVVITHDLATVQQIASRVVMIHENKLHFNDSGEKLFASNDPIVRRFVERSFLKSNA